MENKQISRQLPLLHQWCPIVQRGTREGRSRRILCNATGLNAAKALAISRVLEQKSPDPLINDPYVHSFLSEVRLVFVCYLDFAFHAQQVDEAEICRSKGESLSCTLDTLSTHFIDDCLLQATSLVNEEHGDYRQVVFVSPGLDTRAFRLPWPKNIVIYDVAPQEVHSFMKEKLQPQPLAACLRVPVALDVRDSYLLPSLLERVGFRGDRLSVWAIQGLHAMDLTSEELESLFFEISQLSKCKSLVFGELRGATKSEVSQFLSEFGLFGTVTDFTDPDISFNRLQLEDDNIDRFLFSYQQQMLSAKEQEIYEAHVQAAEETDEDFFENIS